MDPAAFQDFLLRGERIAWTGRAGGGLMLTRGDAIMIPFSLFWCAFIVIWLFGSYAMGAPPTFQVFGIPFLLVGIYMLVGRFFIDAWIRGGTFYALTDRRLLTLKTKPAKTLTALDLSQLPELVLEEGRNGRGTIRLMGPMLVSSRNSRGFSSQVPAIGTIAQLTAIEEPRRVFELLQRAKDEARPAITGAAAGPSSS